MNQPELALEALKLVDKEAVLIERAKKLLHSQIQRYNRRKLHLTDLRRMLKVKANRGGESK